MTVPLGQLNSTPTSETTSNLVDVHSDCERRFSAPVNRHGKPNAQSRRQDLVTATTQGTHDQLIVTRDSGLILVGAVMDIPSPARTECAAQSIDRMANQRRHLDGSIPQPGTSRSSCPGFFTRCSPGRDSSGQSLQRSGSSTSVTVAARCRQAWRRSADKPRGECRGAMPGPCIRLGRAEHTGGNSEL